MLQIIVRPSTHSPGGVVDLLPNTRLEIDRPTDPFDEDLSSSEFSLPIEIEWTENNKKIFGFSERMENFLLEKVNSWICDVFDGYPELINASINLLEEQGSITYDKGRFTANVSAARGQFGTQARPKYLKDFSYGPEITWLNDESRVFATKHAKGLVPGMTHFAFAPVVIQEYFDTSKNYYGEFLAQDTVNNLISTGVGTNDWLFGRPLSDTPTIPSAPGHAEHVDYRTIPFFKLKYILQQLIQQLGYTIAGTALETAILEDLYIYNTRSIEDYDFSLKIDKNRKIIPGNHLPDITVVDFLRNSFQFLNVYASFPGGQVIELKQRSNFMDTRRILDVTAICVKEFSSQYVATEDQGGYTLDYEHDGSDAYFSEAVRDISDKTFVATVNVRTQLGTLNIGRLLTTEDIALVNSENLYYRVADATVSPVLWSAYAEKLHPLVVGNGNRTVSTGAGTLATYIELDEPSGLYRRFSKLASRQAGCYINNKNILVKNEFSLRFMLIKHQVIGGNSYPVSFNHNTTPTGTAITETSLALQGEKSIGALHKTWQDMQSHPKKYMLQLLADKKLKIDLDQHNMIMLNNVVMVPRMISLAIPLGETVKVEAVPL
jgi:hypothetical protein